MGGLGTRPDVEDRGAPGRHRNASDHEEPALRQAWLEEQAALYQGLCERPDKPSPVEFAARVVLPEGMAPQGFDLRARLIRRLHVLDGLSHALGLQGGGAGEDFQTGDIFQDLEILEPIARGGMGRVFRARQRSLGRVVALKTPHWAACLDPREKARFWREAQAIARLHHPGIVPLYAVGQRSGTPFLVLELVDGRPLSEVIQLLKRGALPATGASLGREGVGFEHAAAGLAIEILSALQAAHEAGIVHRDVKPANVMLESSGRVRVLDFGLAKLQLDESLTHSGEFLGTVQFTAPEILENPRGANPASDVYSVGVVLYELLSLELPFEDTSLRGLMQRVLADEPKPLHTRCRVSRSLSAIVSKAITRDPASRYQSAREFAADLGSFVRGAAVSARPATVLGRLPQLARRYVTQLAAVLSAITLAALVASLLTRNTVQAGLDPGEVHDTLRSALLWDLAETQLVGAWPADDDGSERALERLDASVRDDRRVIFPRARVHLAVVAAERGDGLTALGHLVELEAAGWEYEAMRWVRERLASGTGGRGTVRPSTGRTPDSTGNDVDRYYLVRGEALARAGTTFQAPLSLEGHPIYAAPVLFLAALGRTEGAERELATAVEQLREVRALVPHHPVIEAAPLRWACARVAEEAWQRTEVEAYLAPLRPSAEATAATRPTYPAFWRAYENLLILLGDQPGQVAGPIGH